MNKLSQWLISQLDDRGWSQRELARRSGISQSRVNNVINGIAIPDARFCLDIARVFGVPIEQIYRLADLWIPSRGELVDADPRLGEAHQILDQLGQSHLDTVLAMLRGLVNTPPLQYVQSWSARTASALTDQGVAYGGNATPAIEHTFYRLPKSFQEIIVDQINSLAALANAEMLEKIAREADLMGGHNEDTNATQPRPVNAGILSPAPIDGAIDQ